MHTKAEMKLYIGAEGVGGGNSKIMNINRLMFIIDRSDAMNLSLGDAAMRMTNGQSTGSI